MPATLPQAARAAGRELEGKVAWVTGAGRGLGRAIALELARAGARVAVQARTAEDLNEVAGIIEAEGGRALILSGSVVDSHFTQESADTIAGTLGGLDVLVNSAGINPVVSPSEALSDEDWRRVVETNLTGTFYCCREAGRRMKLSGGGGAIVNISSVHGSTGVARMAAYAASKGAIESLTKALAVEWAADGIRVNCLAPGYFRTDMTDRYLNSRHGETVLARTPMGRVGDPPELVGAARFLAGNRASFMTGAVVPVDGGWTAV